jgi:hypothetical protein
MPKKVALLLLFALLPGCEERERLTFPSDDPGDDTAGPTTVIDIPGQDTTITASVEGFVLGGRSVDPSGIELVQVEISGAGFSFPPIEGQGEDTVRFGLQIPTAGRNGVTLVVRLFGVDVLGNPGATVARQLTVE